LFGHWRDISAALSAFTEFLQFPREKAPLGCAFTRTTNGAISFRHRIGQYLSVELGWIWWNVDRVGLDGFQWDYVEDAVVCRRKHHGRSHPFFVRPQPIGCCHAPSIAWDEPWEVELGHRRCEVVPDARLVVEEFAGHDGANRVASVITLVGIARPITEEASDRINTTCFKFEAEDVQRHLKPPVVRREPDSECGRR
jgi:hypothetical protein